jgi:cyanate lyase
MKLYTQEQVLQMLEVCRDSDLYEHILTFEDILKTETAIQTKRTLIIYNTKETTEDEARHLLEILNCDDSTLWDNADHCGVQVLEVPIQGGNNEQQ